LAPPDLDAEGSDEGVEGVHRFLSRLWRLASEIAERGEAGSHATLPGAAHVPPRRSAHAPTRTATDDLMLQRKAHWAIDKVSGDLRRFAFNTAIAAVMELLNESSRLREVVAVDTLRFALCTCASLLFPFAPHLSTEVYELLAGERVWEQPWPQADPALLESDTYELVCQVNGKLRDRVQAAADASPEELRQLCRAAPNVKMHVDGKEIVKEVVVPGKLVNLVVR
jgi:leucyl-tRNA synthetase